MNKQCLFQYHLCKIIITWYSGWLLEDHPIWSSFVQLVSVANQRLAYTWTLPVCKPMRLKLFWFLATPSQWDGSLQVFITCQRQESSMTCTSVLLMCSGLQLLEQTAWSTGSEPWTNTLGILDQSVYVKISIVAASFM